MRFLCLCYVLLFAMPSRAQYPCRYQVDAFQDGEAVTYEISYNLGPVWLNAGEVTFGAEKTELDGKPSLRFYGDGQTYKNYDWIYKVRDHYQSWADPETLEPQKFVRDVQEGKSRIFNTYYFNTEENQAVAEWYNVESEPRSGIDTVAYEDCTFDVMTAIYYCRGIDFSNCEIGDTVPLTLLLDRQIETTWIRYLGQGVHETRAGNHIRCIIFKPLLIEGTIFEGGENMEVWVSDDVNRIPVYVESKILVGSIKVYVKETRGLRNDTDYR